MKLFLVFENTCLPKKEKAEFSKMEGFFIYTATKEEAVKRAREILLSSFEHYKGVLHKYWWIVGRPSNAPWPVQVWYEGKIVLTFSDEKSIREEKKTFWILEVKGV